MTTHPITRRTFLGTAAALAAPAVLPGSVLGCDRRPSEESLRVVDSSLMHYSGCSLNELKGSETVVLPHQAFLGYEKALALRHGDSCIISVPHMMPEIERSRLRAARPAEAFDPGFLAKALLISPDRVEGPSWIGIADRASFTPVQSDALLRSPERPALMNLLKECGDIDWWRSGLSGPRGPIFGLFLGTDLAAVSSYVMSGDRLATIAILTHPAHRGKGYGKAAAGAAVAGAIDKGLVVLWRAPESKKGAVAFGKALGFHHYASTRGIRLAEDTF